MTDKIEKRVFLRATRAKVWRAISDAKQFSAWFGVNLEGDFAAGESIRGKVTYKGLEHLTMEIAIVAIEPERYFAYRWHPAALDPNVDYSSEPTTLVEFELAEADGGCQLSIRESGLDKIPEARRANVLRLNSEGWTEQVANIEKYLARA
jgi:uncharacterized protein YndB with AHSA1/START domain